MLCRSLRPYVFLLKHFLTLPKLAQLAMWENYNQCSPYVFTFQHRFNYVRVIFREKLTGGLCNVMWVCYAKSITYSDCKINNI